MTSSREMNETLLRELRSGELDWLLALMVLMALFMVWFVLWYFPRIIKKGEKRAREVAKAMVSEEWRLIDCSVHADAKARLEGVVIEIQSLDFKRKHIIPFRPAHPSIANIQRLERCEIFGFEYVEGGMECALETEVCGYLKLKSS